MPRTIYNFNIHATMKLSKTILLLFVLSSTLSAAATKIIVNSGYRNNKEAIEYSISALKEAGQSGVSGISVDIRLTKDGVPVVYKDNAIDGMNIEETAYAKIKNRKLENNEKLPTLENYLNEAKKYAGLQVVLSIENHQNTTDGKRYAAAAVQAVKKTQTQQLVSYTSTDVMTCRAIKSNDPNAAVYYRKGDFTPSQIEDVGLSGLNYTDSILNRHPEWIEEARQLGLTTCVNTGDNMQSVRTYTWRKADFILTSHPQEAGKVIAENTGKQFYTAEGNVHAHNDYWHTVPFYVSYCSRIGSIEADIFLVDGELYVSHTREDIDKKRTLKALYLDPLKQQMYLNGGKAYPDGRPLLLFIDLKTDYETTLPALQQLLEQYKSCFDIKNNPSAVQVVITGNRPEPENFSKYADFIYYDGKLDAHYTPQQLQKVGLYGAGFFLFSNWNGIGDMPSDQFATIKNIVEKVHNEGKKIRFWGNPDTPLAWKTLMKAGVDYINTDHPKEVADYMLHHLIPYDK